MTTHVKSNEIDPDYPGSDNHLPVKKDDKSTRLRDKTEGGGVSQEVEDTIHSVDADTDIANKLKAAVGDAKE